MIIKTTWLAAVFSLLAALSHAADTIELLPGKITGTVQFPGETILHGSITAQPADGSGTASTSFTGDSYSLLLPGGKTWVLQVSVALDTGSSGSSYFGMHLLSEHVTVAADETVTKNIVIPAARVFADVQVLNGTLTSIAMLQAGGTEGLQYSFSSSSQGLSWVAALPIGNVNVSGTATVLSSDGQASTQPLVQRVLSLSGGNVTESWTLDAAFSAGAIQGAVNFQGLATPSQSTITLYNESWSHVGSTTVNAGSGNGSFQFTNLLPGTHNLYGYFDFPNSQLSTYQQATVTAGSVSEVNFAGNTAQATIDLELTGFLTRSSIGGANLYGSTYSSTSSNSTLPATGPFVAVITPGEWMFSQANLFSMDTSSPSDYLYSSVSIYDYARGSTPVVFAAGESKTLPSFVLNTAQTELTFDVTEPAGATAETLISGATISGSALIVDASGNPAQQISLYDANWGSPQAKPRVRVIGPPGTYQLNASGNVDGSSVSFGQFSLDLTAPLPTSIGNNVTVQPTPGATVLFENVTSAGVTSGAALPVGPQLPAGYSSVSDSGQSTFYNITTTATFDGSVNVTLEFDPSLVAPEQLANLSILSYDNATQQWVDVTASVDPTANTITGSVSSLSLFVVALTHDPVLGDVLLPESPQKDLVLTFTAPFTDGDANDVHSALWTWGDGSTSAGIIDAATGTITGEHTYAQTASYQGSLSITDSTGGSDTASFTVAMRTVQKLTILGGSGNAGEIDPHTEYSKDGGQTWHPAYLTGGHPWGFIEGTSSWINQDPSPFVGLNETVDFRVRFTAPDVIASPKMTFTINADNHAALSVNGIAVDDTEGGTQPDTKVVDADYIQPGVNTINIRLTDFGGWVGINFRIDLEVEADAPLEVVTPPPVIGGFLSGVQMLGSEFVYQIEATNSPTSYGATGLPAGFSFDGATGLISGTFTQTGVYQIGLSATNAGGTAVATLTIEVAPGQVSVALGDLLQIYDGAPKAATVTTFPENIPFSVTYDGSSTPPTNVGSYNVLATVTHPNYVGEASDILVIEPAPAGIELGNLTQPYDGSPKSVSVTTTPANVATSVTYNGSSDAPIHVGSYSVIATILDGNYVASSATGTLTITDTIKPELALPASPIVVEATSAAGAMVSFELAANDNVDGAILVTTSHESGSGFALGETVVNATAQDAAGNIATGSFTVSVVDTTAPVILMSPSAPAAVTIANGGFEQPGTWDHDHTVASWQISGVAGVVYVPVLTGRYVTGVAPEGRQVAFINVGSISQTLSTTLEAGKTYTLSGYVGRRSDDPITTGRLALVTSSGVVLAQADSAADQPIATFAGYTASFTPAAGDPNLGATLKIVLTNTSNQQVNFDDVRLTVSEAPTSAPADIVAEATSSDGAVVGYTATAIDIVSGTVAVSAAPASGSTFAIGSTPVTLGAIDAAGNPAMAAFNVIVRDTTKPVLNIPANQLLEATSAAGAIATFSVTATDNVGALVTTSAASGSTFPLGTTVVEVAAIDAAGNEVTGSFTITVVDTTAPVIATPGNIVAEATSAAGAVVTFAVSAADVVDGDIIVNSSHVSGGVFPIGTTTVTVDTVDAAGNVSSSSFTVTVQDTIAPVIATLENQIIEATGPAGAVATFAATASDAVGANVSYSVVPGSSFALGTTTVTVTAADAAGNSSTAVFTVLVRDTTAPALFPPAGQTLEATSAEGSVATFAASAFDIVSGDVPVSFSHAPGSTFALGSTTVSASVTDAAGNIASAVFSIVVVDTTAPVITAPANIVIEATGASGAIATFSASALDIVSGSIPVNTSKASGSLFALGTTVVTLNAMDAAGNSSTTSFAVTVVDTTAPTIEVPADIVIDSATVMGATATYGVTASDIVDGPLTVTLSKASGTIFPIGTTVVTATATDAAGNTATKTFNVTVRAPAVAVVNVLSSMNGTINGSLQQLDDQNVTLNGGAKITGELLVVGTPSTRLNGKPTFGGAVDFTGSASPSNYSVTLNGNASLGKLVRRFNPVAMPTVAAPSTPTGSRSVNMNKGSDAIGAWSTLKNLTLNGNVGNVTVPAGVYGSFTANGNSGFTLGIAGATTPSVYHFESLTLNGNSTFKVVGPVVIVLKNQLNANGSMGSTSNPAWLDLRISNGGLTLNGNVDFHGYVTAPKGTVTINGNSELRGGLVADKLILNGNSELTLLRR